MATISDPDRLERLWAGEFGDAYTTRNADAGANRGPFWDSIRRLFPFESVLEVGCNVGSNLQWLAPHIARSAGVDINPGALRAARKRLPDTTLLESSARALPFPSASYDMVIAVGVLIHQAEDALPGVMREMARVSRRWVLCGEYYAQRREEVPYRGQAGALYRDDYGARFLATCPELRLMGGLFVPKDQGFDNATVWVFEKCA